MIRCGKCGGIQFGDLVGTADFYCKCPIENLTSKFISDPNVVHTNDLLKELIKLQEDALFELKRMRNEIEAIRMRVRK